MTKGCYSEEPKFRSRPVKTASDGQKPLASRKNHDREDKRLLRPEIPGRDRYFTCSDWHNAGYLRLVTPRNQKIACHFVVIAEDAGRNQWSDGQFSTRDRSFPLGSAFFCVGPNLSWSEGVIHRLR